jgi:hypothetical protein
MSEVPLELVLHFPEKTHHIKGYLTQLDLHNEHVDNLVNWGRDRVYIPVETTFTLQGTIANWKDKDGRKQAAAAVDVVAARDAIKRAKRAARRKRERTRRGAGAAS